MKNIILTILFIFTGLFFTSTSYSTVLFYEDFEDELDMTPPMDWVRDGKHGSQELTTEQVRFGAKAYKFSLTRFDSGDYREELTLRNAWNGGSSKFTIGNEYWVGFSIFLPADYSSPIEDGTWVIHHQHHSSEDESPTCEWKEGIRNPIFTIGATDGNWTGWIQYDDQQCTPLQKVGVTMNSFTWDAFSTGQWNDFVVNVKWNYEDAGDGFLKIWKDGVLITDRNGPNCFNDDEGPWVKIGIYAHIDQDQTMTIYYDEFRIGDSASSYAEIVPGGVAIYNPSPGIDDTGTSITADLNWTNPSPVTTSIDLLFDKKADHDPPTTKKLDDQNVETYDCGILDYNTEYAWRVDVNYNGGNDTETGTVYYFTTTSQANPPISATGGIKYSPKGSAGKYCPKGLGL